MIFRAIRRMRPVIGEEEGGGASMISEERDLGAEPVPTGRPRTRRELPADAVRRWYAESLVALDRRAVTKPAAATPAEFAGEVSRAYPGLADDFERLTRAYEDVRYGNLRLDGRELARPRTTLGGVPARRRHRSAARRSCSTATGRTASADDG